MVRLIFIIAVVSCIFLFSCDKVSEGFTATGGQLPTNYIVAKDSSFTPSLIKIVSGSSISFLNQSSTEHIIISDDSISIKTVTLPVNGFYQFKANSFGIINYHCITHPSARGSIQVSY